MTDIRKETDSIGVVEVRLGVSVATSGDVRDQPKVDARMQQI